MLTTDIYGSLTTSGILTNEANVGFEVPEGQSKYLTAGNDVVDLSKWNGTLSVNIGDAFSGDNDKVTVRADALAGLVAKDNLKLTSIENLEIVNSDERNPVILKGANFKGLEAIKLIGDATILNVSDFTQGVKIDATANADYIIGSSKADTINGGAGNDTIVGNGGNDVLTGGNGADTFIVGDVKNFGVDQILDFSAEDKISMVGFTPNELKKFDASTFSTVNYKSLDAALATFLTGGKYQTKAGDVVIFSYDGATYALLSKGEGFNDATDSLVDITGANVASLTESNFGTSGNFENYADFKAAVDAGKVDSPTTIKSITANDAAALLTTDVAYLDKIALGGIGAIDGATVNNGATVNVTMTATTLNTSTFAEKLGSGAIISKINITGTAYDDTITSSFAGSINGGSGNDTIDASTAIGAVTIIDGSGKDTIKGGAGNDDITLTNDDKDSDTVVFAATAAANGVDTITGFTAGNTSSGGDVLNFAAFLGKTTAISGASGNGLGADGTGVAISSSGFDATASGAGNVIYVNDKAELTKANFASSAAGKNVIKVDTNTDYVVIAKDDVNNTNTIYYVEVGTNANSATVTSVGTINIPADAFVAGNFA